MKPKPSFPPMPPEKRAELKRGYDNLPPPHVRWSTRRGQQFLIALETAEHEYGARQCADAIGIVRVRTIQEMLERQVTRTAVGWPSEDDLAELKRAWRDLTLLHDSGRYDRRDRREYEQMHLALTELLPKCSINIIAAAMHVQIRTLRRYLQPPLPNKSERSELTLLVHLYGQCNSPCAGDDTMVRFHEELTRARRNVSLAKIAAALKLSTAEVEELSTYRHAG